MDLDSENRLNICRLCLQTSDDLVNIWKTFRDSTIAAVVSKHFWFRIRENDGLTEWLCQPCWLQTKSFHEFYMQVELFQKCFLESAADNVEQDIGENISSNFDIVHSDETTEHNLSIFKCEETELTLATIDSHVSGHYSSDDNVDEEEKISDKDEQFVNNEPKAKQKDKISEFQDQIRELFNMKCELCSDVEFSTLLKAKQHYRKVHATQGYITCCDTKFIRPNEVVKHIRKHNDVNPAKTRSTHELEKNIREFFSMKCEICNDVEYKSLLDLRRHFRNVHKTSGYVTCCGRKFFRRHKMVAHALNHTNPDEHHCEQCNRSFKTAKSLKSHIDNHIPLDSRKLKCDLCSSSFNTKNQIKHHMQQKHTSKTGEKFPCDKCGKNYRSNFLLSCHIRQLHILAQEYVCEVCARTFKNKHTLQYHINFEHSSTPPPKSQCDICGVWVKHLKTHRKLHTKTNPLNCPICNKEVQTKSRLNYHIAYVHSEKRFPCNLCDKAFKCSKNLKEHIAIHTGEDLYNCPYCEKKFKSNANMYSHRKKAHLAEWTRDFSQRNKSDGIGTSDKTVTKA